MQTLDWLVAGAIEGYAQETALLSSKPITCSIDTQRHSILQNFLSPIVQKSHLHSLLPSRKALKSLGSLLLFMRYEKWNRRIQSTRNRPKSIEVCLATKTILKNLLPDQAQPEQGKVIARSIDIQSLSVVKTCKLHHESVLCYLKFKCNLSHEELKLATWKSDW